jgi:hypothetical protein
MKLIYTLVLNVMVTLNMAYIIIHQLQLVSSNCGLPLPSQQMYILPSAQNTGK